MGAGMGALHGCSAWVLVCPCAAARRACATAKRVSASASASGWTPLRTAWVDDGWDRWKDRDTKRSAGRQSGGWVDGFVAGSHRA